MPPERFQERVERGGLEVIIDSGVAIPPEVSTLVTQLMNDIAHLFATEASRSEAQFNLELYNVVTRLIRSGKSTGLKDIAVKLCKDAGGAYNRVANLLTKYKKHELLRRVEEERLEGEREKDSGNEGQGRGGTVKEKQTEKEKEKEQHNRPSLPSPPVSAASPASPVASSSKKRGFKDESERGAKDESEDEDERPRKTAKTTSSGRPVPALLSIPNSIASIPTNSIVSIPITVASLPKASTLPSTLPSTVTNSNTTASNPTMSIADSPMSTITPSESSPAPPKLFFATPNTNAGTYQNTGAGTYQYNPYPASTSAYPASTSAYPASTSAYPPLIVLPGVLPPALPAVLPAKEKTAKEKGTKEKTMKEKTPLPAPSPKEKLPTPKEKLPSPKEKLPSPKEKTPLPAPKELPPPKQTTLPAPKQTAPKDKPAAPKKQKFPLPLKKGASMSFGGLHGLFEEPPESPDGDGESQGSASTPRAGSFASASYGSLLYSGPASFGGSASFSGTSGGASGGYGGFGSTPRPTTKPHFTHRTLPRKMNAAKCIEFERFYRRFPLSAFWTPMGGATHSNAIAMDSDSNAMESNSNAVDWNSNAMVVDSNAMVVDSDATNTDATNPNPNRHTTDSPCAMFDVPHPGGTYVAPNDPYSLYNARFVVDVDEANGETKAPVAGEKKMDKRTKKGLCPICIEPTLRGGEGEARWYKMGTPAYQNHMQFVHGISAVTLRPFSPPTSVSLVYESGVKEGERGYRCQEGKCHQCEEWIALEDENHNGMGEEGELVKESLWWKHAARCHRGSTIPGEQDVFEPDLVYDTVRRALGIDEHGRAVSPEPESPGSTSTKGKGTANGSTTGSASGSTKATGSAKAGATGSVKGTGSTNASPAKAKAKATKPKSKPKPPKPKVKGKRDMTQNDEGYCFPFCANRGTQMIACEDRECEIEWYHLKCVGLHAPPPGAAQWFCDVCKARRAATRAERGQRRAGWINPEILKRAEILSYQLADKLRDEKPTFK